jgi:hypothetical protein
MKHGISKTIIPAIVLLTKDNAMKIQRIEAIMQSAAFASSLKLMRNLGTGTPDWSLSDALRH